MRRLIIAQRIVEDAGAIANFANLLAAPSLPSERRTLLEGVSSRRQAIEVGLGELEGLEADRAVVATVRDALGELVGSANQIAALADQDGRARRTLEAMAGALGQRIEATPAGDRDQGLDQRLLAELALALSQTSPLGLDRLEATLAASPDEELRRLAGGLPAARREQLDVVRRLRNLGRVEWEKASRLLALVSGYAADVRLRQEAQITRLWAYIADFGLLLGLAFAVTLAAVAWLSRGFSRAVISPLTALTEATRKIAAGDLNAAIEPPTAAVEIRDLADALIVFRDATRELHEQRDALAWRSVAIEAAAEAFIITSAVGVIEYVNPAFTTLTGYDAVEAVGSALTLQFNAAHDQGEHAQMWESVLGGGVWSGEVVNRHRDGALYVAAMTIAPVFTTPAGTTQGGRPSHFVAVERDITQSRRAQQELYLQATTDALTGLYNRRHLLEIGQLTVDQSTRFAQPLSVLLLDVDHFKAINDAHGHAAGDRALCALAQTCQKVVRNADILARIGGEEFVVVLPRTDLAGAHELAERIRRAIETIQVAVDDGPPIRFTVSLGIGELAPGFDRFEAILAAADRALYQAKRGGRNRVACVAA